MSSQLPFSLSRGGFRRYRLRLTVALMSIVVVLTAVGLVVAGRNATAQAANSFRVAFLATIGRIESARQQRTAVLVAHCEALAKKSRIHAAIEDDALDLLYPSARDELAGLLVVKPRAVESASPHAVFCRFLDAQGKVIPPPDETTFGRLEPTVEERLSLPELQAAIQFGYVTRTTADGRGLFEEVITTPIFSTATHRPVAALVVGFPADVTEGHGAHPELRRGLWLGGELHFPGLPPSQLSQLAAHLRHGFDPGNAASATADVELGGEPYLLLGQQINPGSRYAPAFEISLFSTAGSLAEQRTLRRRVLGAGLALLLVGAIAAQVMATRLSHPVEQLVAVSQTNVDRRREAEASLKSTQVELERAARFSADASHQLKTPVAVLRAGLQELLARDDLTPAVRTEIATLLGETQHFTGMIEDLLLLSRMDAGRLTIDFAPVDLSHLVASWLDDLSVRPLTTEPPTIMNELPPELLVAGERRYTWHIIANLLENALRYNRPGGTIRIRARPGDGAVHLCIANTGRAIPRESQPYIFERFHRGAVATGVPGHGLGLNLARELARLHGGDLVLVHSGDDLTEFEAAFRHASAAVSAA